MPVADPAPSARHGSEPGMHVSAPRLRPSMPSVLRYHPEWLVLAVAALSWVGLAWLLGATVPLGHHHHESPADASGSFDTHLAVWVVMLAAMMLPTTLPHLRYVGFNTRVPRRQRSLLLFALGYLAAWLLPGVVLALMPMPAPPVAVAVVALAAAVWELTPIKRRALRGCCRTWPVRYTGPAADASALEYGLRHGCNCLLVSGPAMIVMMLAGHPWWAIVVLTVVMAAQKLLTEPQRWRAVVALGWLATGLAVAGVAAFD